MFEPWNLVKLLDDMNNIDNNLRTYFKCDINYGKIRITPTIKMFVIAAVYLLFIFPYYIINHHLYTLEILCFEIFADFHNTAQLSFYLFYIEMLNDRIKAVNDLTTDISHKKAENSILIHHITNLNDLYGKLWRVSTKLNQTFGVLLVSIVIFIFIDFVFLTFYFCKELQSNTRSDTSLAIFFLLLGLTFETLVFAKYTDNVKEYSNGIGVKLHLIDVCDHNDTSLTVLLKDFSSHVLFQPIFIKSVFFQMDLGLLVPVSSDIYTRLKKEHNYSLSIY